MSDKKKCPFCEAIALQRFIEEHHSKPAGFGMALSAALVSYAVVNGRKCGRTTDYMKDGKGYPLNYCPRTPLNTAGGKAKERFRRSWRLFIRRYPKRWRNTATGNRFFISPATLAAFVAKRTEARIAEAALTIRKIRTPVVPRRAKSPKGSRRSLPT